MDEMFEIDKEELEKNDPAEDYYICDDCHDKHLVRHSMAKVTFCTVCYPSNCLCKPMKLGFYRCGNESYLYSINGRQIV